MLHVVTQNHIQLFPLYSSVVDCTQPASKSYDCTFKLSPFYSTHNRLQCNSCYEIAWPITVDYVILHAFFNWQFKFPQYWLVYRYLTHAPYPRVWHKIHALIYFQLHNFSCCLITYELVTMMVIQLLSYFKLSRFVDFNTKCIITIVIRLPDIIDPFVILHVNPYGL
jgi:hypothetical protein